MATRIKVGDIVKLNPESEWVNKNSKEKDSANPLNMQGTITEINKDDVYL